MSEKNEKRGFYTNTEQRANSEGLDLTEKRALLFYAIIVISALAWAWIFWIAFTTGILP